MDRLEKGSGQTVVTLQEAKSLLKEDDDLIIAVYDYWLNKRLKTVSFFLEIRFLEGYFLIYTNAKKGISSVNSAFKI
jgi:hypothetical protein